MTSKDFTVNFGRTARTLDYHDQQGELVFTFDLGPTEPKSICLEHYPPQTQRVPRYRTAFERAKQYLESCGYQVEIHGSYAAPASMCASDVTKLIQTELACHKQIAGFGIDLSKCLIPPVRAEFNCQPENVTWELWLVLEEPRHRLKIVFDEHSKQFGVAHNGFFEGFYGTFVQTLDAISKVG